MACKLAVLLALAAGTADAQQPQRPMPAASGKVMHFQKPADQSVAVYGSGAVAPGHNIVQAGAQDKDKKPDDKKSELTPEEKEKLEREQQEKDRAKYVKLPPLVAVFSLPNDAELEEAILNRLRQDELNAVPPRDPYVKYPKDRGFPTNPPVGAGIAYVPKTSSYPPMRVNYDALYVVHRRLLFEEKNAERYGWDLGIIQPFVSTAIFYKDVLLLPNSLASGFAYGFWDTNAGKCLPGSPTPYMLYPPGLTITGTTFEAVVITGAAFVFP